MGVLAKQAYKSYLQSKHWSDLRRLVLDQVDSRCCICYKQSESNEVHHIYYCGNWYKTKPHHLAVLCDEHHDAVHNHIDLTLDIKPSEHFKNFYKVRDHLRSMSIGGLLVGCFHPEIVNKASKRPQGVEVLRAKDAKAQWNSRRRQRWDRWQKLTDFELDKIESVIELVTRRKIKS